MSVKQLTQEWQQWEIEEAERQLPPPSPSPAELKLASIVAAAGHTSHVYLVETADLQRALDQLRHLEEQNRSLQRDVLILKNRLPAGQGDLPADVGDHW